MPVSRLTYHHQHLQSLFRHEVSFPFTILERDIAREDETRVAGQEYPVLSVSARTVPVFPE
jgi:hypothetical protein